MKKQYISPSMKVRKIEFESNLLDFSNGADGTMTATPSSNINTTLSTQDDILSKQHSVWGNDEEE